MLQDKLSDLRLVLDESIENVVELQDCSDLEQSEQMETLQLLGEAVFSLLSVYYSAIVLLMIGYLFSSSTENIIMLNFCRNNFKNGNWPGVWAHANDPRVETEGWSAGNLKLSGKTAP